MPEPEDDGAGVDVPPSVVVLSTVAVSPRLSRYPNFRRVVVVGAEAVVFKAEILADDDDADDDVDGGVSADVFLVVDADVRHSPNKTTAAMFNRILFPRFRFCNFLVLFDCLLSRQDTGTDTIYNTILQTCWWLEGRGRRG